MNADVRMIAAHIGQRFVRALENIVENFLFHDLFPIALELNPIYAIGHLSRHKKAWMGAFLSLLYPFAALGLARSGIFFLLRWPDAANRLSARWK
jgi:hypothetical protein